MSTTYFDVLIVGAGVSGIGMACTLMRECPNQSFAILERREQLGGTWDLFRYPGVRSDSDMFTYGYTFRPWKQCEVLADGGTIREYLGATAREHGVDQHIRYGVRIASAAWSSASQSWSVTDDTGRTLRCRQLVMATGYYNHDAGHQPAFPGLSDFEGQVVHPQQWPQDLDYVGKQVVVVGSGATAITLVPAMADTAAHVTMLQRSPTYIMSVPAHDALTALLLRVLPARWTFWLARKRNIAIAGWIYQAARKWPEKSRKFLLGRMAEHLGGSAEMRHFTPNYQPWDQRVCIVPDADLFRAIRRGRASVVTDHIAGFRGKSIVLASGQELAADILVSATGLELQAFGGMQILVDGQPYNPHQHMLYKGVLMQDLPNFSWILGYTNASWTLKADLSAMYICRLIRHMQAAGMGVAVARDTVGCKLPESVMGALNSGYIARASDRMPRQGSRLPWRTSSHYPSDKKTLLSAPIDDGVLSFQPFIKEQPHARTA